MEATLANLPSDPAALRAIILAQALELAAREAELRSHSTLIEKLKAQLATLRRARFGSSSGKLERIADQLELTLEEIEESQAQDEDGARATDADAVPSVAAVTKRAKPSRQFLPDHLRRHEVGHAAPCACHDCGGTRFLKAGTDITEVLDYVPASFRVVRHVWPTALLTRATPVSSPVSDVIYEHFWRRSSASMPALSSCPTPPPFSPRSPTST